MTGIQRIKLAMALTGCVGVIIMFISWFFLVKP